MSDIEFVDGLIFKLPRDGAPEFVKGSLSIKREELIAFLSGKQGEWINIDLKVSQKGKAYAQVNNWKPDGNQQAPQQQSAPSQVANNDFDEDLPF